MTGDDEVVVTVLTTASSREDLIEAIVIMNREARREMAVVGTAGYPTPWDACHGHIDALLDELAGR